MVAVAQLVEPLTVTQVVVGSSPIGHPNIINKKSPAIAGLFVFILARNHAAF